MNAKLTWRNRDAMLVLGQRVLHSHYQNNLSLADMNRWYRESLPRFVSYSMGPKVKPTDKDAMELAFWRDAEILLILLSGLNPEDFGINYRGQFDHLVKAVR